MIHFVCTRKGEMNNFTQIRVGRREKYFGHKTHENLSKLTDLLFKERRDNYFLASILVGQPNISKKMNWIHILMN